MNSVRSRRVILDGGSRPATVRWSDGVITSIDDGPADRELGDLVVMAGLVDSHVHVNEPGRTDWEGFSTATAAAAAGGTTTIADMPLNSIPPTVDPYALRVKRAAADGKLSVDTAFWGGIIPGSGGHVPTLIEGGVCGFKVFLSDSGVPEFPPITIEELREVVGPLVEQGIPLLVHAEDPDLLLPPVGDPASHLTHLRSRSPNAEETAIRTVVELTRVSGVRTHILHLAAGGGVDIVAAARETGLPVTAETCPHYLYFDGEGVPDGATEHKCAPPIRGRDHADALWGGLDSGAVDMVVSDHSPAPADLKTPGDFVAAWGGISSLQLRLPVTWTEARRRGHGPADLASWLAQAPAVLAGLDDRKGAIREGVDADLVVWDPDGIVEVRAEGLEHRHPVTPYDGHTLYGRVEHTILRGETVYTSQEGVIPGLGHLLARTPQRYKIS